MRPVLVVNESQLIPCRAFAAISTGTVFPTKSTSVVSVSRNASGLIQFPLEGVDVQSAELRLYVISKSSGSNKLSINRLDPPVFELGGQNVRPPEATEADIIREIDWDALRPTEHHEVIDVPGGRALRGKFVPKTGTKDTRKSFETKVQTMPADLTDPLRPPSTITEELYCRMYVLLEDDWLSTRDGNKGGIGWDLRMGWWNDVGYWQSTTGNGGAPGTGLKLFAPAGSLGGSQTEDRWEYQGHSIRMEFGKGQGDGNPYDHLRPVQSYTYHLDQNGGYGSMIRLGRGVVERGKWFCIEQRVRMNTVVGPFDEFGNGTAIADGVLETWLNGTLISSRTNLRWTRNLEMGVQAMWINWYYGGKNATEREMHYQIRDCVVAREYIGLKAA
jgi:hypothetical protein